MGWRDLIPDSAEDWVEDRAEDLGELIELGGDNVAGVADDMGWESAGDWVRDKSRSAANQLGADVAELELGQTEDPKRLIYGSPAKIREQVGHLNDFKESFTSVGNGLKNLAEPDGLKGAAATAFREAVAKEPPRWFKAAKAFGDAAQAMSQFAETVEWAQNKAKEALDDYNAAKKASQDAYNAHKKLVDAYRDAAEAKKEHLPPRPADTYDDPGKAMATAAQDKLDNARKQRNDVAETVRTAVRTARDAAPPKPSYAEQLADGMDYVDLAKTHLAGGVIKGAAGMVSFARSLNPADPYNITHPAEYVTSLNSTAAGLVTMANDPWGAGKKMLDDFMKDSNEGIGKFLFELGGSKGAGAAKKAATAAKHLEDTKGPARQGLDNDGPDAHSTPDSGTTTGDTDPIDLATGRMFLPQTDIVLPGTLPLAFVRRAESGYTAGRWFGPSWASTIDQHLEIDAAGVVLVSEDGLLVAYPHPAPGVPVMPGTGPLRPLERMPDGDWVLTDPASGHVRRFSPPADGAEDGIAPIAQIEDRNGNLITFEYDDQGVPLGISHSGGYRLRFDTADGRVTALHLADGPRILAYGYTDGNLTEVTNSSSLPLRLTYDDRGRITSWTDTNNSRYDYTYDDQNRCVAQGGSEGHLALTLSYDAREPKTGNRITAVTTPEGHTRRYLIDDRYRVVAEIDPLGAVTRYQYDSRGRVISRTDPLGATCLQEYDEAGRITRAIRPDGRTAGIEYDELGLPVRVANADGTIIRQTYDERGNRTSLTTSAGAVTTFGYDERGHVVTVTNPLGAVTRYTTDAAGLPLTITDPLGATSRCERDAFGRPVRVTDPLGGVTTVEWTPEGLPARRVDPDGAESVWSYDGEGNCTAFTDPAGGVTRFEYTHFDLLAARTGPDGVRHEYTYDALLRLTGVRNPQGLTWEYKYDAAGRLTSETDFDGLTLSYSYDPTGRLRSRTNGLGEEIAYERDVLGRIIRKTSPAGTATFEFDVFDLPAAAVSSDGTTLVRIRDRHGRLVEEQVDGRTVRYAYDELSRPVTMTTPTGAETRWRYDAGGHCTEITASGRTLTFERDAAGRELTRRIGDTTELHQTFDAAGRLTTRHITGPDQRTLLRRGYSYRADGNLLAIDDEATGPRTFTLDSASRVTAVDAASWSERYAYDEAGNQTSAAWPEQLGAEAIGDRAYTGTRITRAGRVRYEHDAQGRVILRQKTRLSRKPDTWHYTWDADDRLTEVTTPDGTRWRYRYDALGRRAAKQRLASSDASHETSAKSDEVVEETVFTWDGPTLIEQTTRSAGNPHEVTLTWTHSCLHPLTQAESIRQVQQGARESKASQEEIDSRFFAIVTDLVGTPTELIDEQGEVAWRTRSTVWGKTSWNRDASAYTPLRFPGQYHDPETGLHHNYFRTYDPETARYLTSDPLGLAPAPNPVAYVTNPHVWVDPLGLSGCPKKDQEQKALPPSKRGDTVPHLEGSTIVARFAKPGEEFNMVISRGQTDPGGFGTFDDVPNQQYVRDQMAVRTDWKPDVSLLQRYRISDGDPILVQESIIGPQMDEKLGRLPGGGTQIEIMEFTDRARLIPVGPPKEIPK